MAGELVALVTCPPEAAESLSAALVDGGLAACANIVGSVLSVYRWEGEVQKEPESLLIIKTSQSVFEAFEARVKELHPYDVPEIIAIPVERGSKEYLDWLNSSVLR